MDARYYNGDDDRDIWGGPGPDDCGCWDCGVDADTPCLTGCACAHCQRAQRLEDRSHHPSDTWAEHRGER
jgi:hypothetical protein